jgi:hypothetical protein
MPDMASFGIFAGAATVVALGWNYVRAFYDRIVGLAIVTVQCDDSDATNAFFSLLWSKFRRSPPTSRNYTIWNRLRRSTSQFDYFLFESLRGGTQLFWDGWKPILILSTKDSNGYDKMSIKFIRGTFDADKLMVEATKLFATRIKSNVQESRFKVVHLQGATSKMSMQSFGASGMSGKSPDAVSEDPASDAEVLLGYRPLTGGIEDIGERIEINEPLACLALNETVESGIEAAKKWFQSRDWYELKRIPWRLGWGLHGPPGNGKSSLARGMAQKFRIPIFVFDLSTMDNTEFDTSWNRMMEETPCVALFEDFDNVFHGRKNITAGEDSNALTFDAVLNAISGVKQANGVFLIVTTNDITKIDEALGVPKDGKSTRPGRLDECFYLDNPCQVGRTRIASRILSECPDLIPAAVEDGAGESGAQFQHRCELIALDHYWKNKQPQNRNEL